MPLEKTRLAKSRKEVGKIIPGPLTNARRELFCQHVASGRPVPEAYMLAGYEPHAGNANAMRCQPDVAHRISEILAAREKRGWELPFAKVAVREVSKEWVMAKLITLAEGALADDDRPAAARSLELIGKELGMFIQRTEIGRAGEFDAMDAAALRRELMQAAKAVGVADLLQLEGGKVVEGDPGSQSGVAEEEQEAASAGE